MADLDEVLAAGQTRLADLLHIAEHQNCINQAQGQEQGPELSEHESDDRIVDILDQYMDRNGQPSGRFRKNKNNLYIILRRDRRWRGRVWLNSFTNTLKIDDRDYKDTDDTRIALWVSRSYDLEYGEAAVSSTVQLIGEENKRNPLLEWLDSIEWDGVNRLNSWVVEATDCEDNELNRKMGEKWLIQAIARAYEPGCKADCVLIFAGAQGAGKSTLFRTLATDEYFADTPLDIGSANSYSQIARAWIYEVAELDSVRRSANSATKAFLSAQEDNFRPAYGRHAITIKRHVVFAGTTNESQFINDMTGSRRYWPIKVDAVNLNWVRENRDQLWAEAILAYKNGETWYLDKKLDKVRHDSSKIYRQDDPWLEPISSFLMLNRGYVTMTMVMEDGLKIERGRMNRRDEMRISEILRELDYEKKRMTVGGKRKYVWAKNEILTMTSKEA
jgi:putative DNA primase/helicase